MWEINRNKNKINYFNFFFLYQVLDIYLRNKWQEYMKIF